MHYVRWELTADQVDGLRRRAGDAAVRRIAGYPADHQLSDVDPCRARRRPATGRLTAPDGCRTCDGARGPFARAHRGSLVRARPWVRRVITRRALAVAKPLVSGCGTSHGPQSLRRARRVEVSADSGSGLVATDYGLVPHPPGKFLSEPHTIGARGHSVPARTLSLIHRKTIPTMKQSWRQHAACRGLDPVIFYPASSDEDAEAAKDVCAECAVRTACLEHALAVREKEGVWGGCTERERRRIIRQRRRAS